MKQAPYSPKKLANLPGVLTFDLVMYSSFSSHGLLLLCGCTPWLGFTKPLPMRHLGKEDSCHCTDTLYPTGALVKNDLLRVFFLGFSMTSQLPHCAVWCFPADCLVGIISVIPLCCFHPSPQEAEATWRWCAGPLLYLTLFRSLLY